MSRRVLLTICLGMLFVAGSSPLRAQDADIADIPSEDLRAGRDPNMRYFLIGPAPGTAAPGDAAAPPKGLGLVVILPGGPGSADFLPFVKRICKNALPPGFVAAQPVSVMWTPQQQIIWPTEKIRAAGMKFSTEKFVASVIADAASRRKIDPARIYTLSWSSSGPAAYALSLSTKKIRGSFVAMSVFKPNELPPLPNAKGHAYYLYHSPDDKTCPYPMAEQAAAALKKAGAAATLVQYPGGHGWLGNTFPDLRAGFDWLEQNPPAPGKK